MSTASHKYVLHLLPNAHLDPVWLWDWREGLNEGLVTIRTILDLMDEAPKLTFIRGEASIYEHVERTDPKLFDRIVAMVAKGRWDVVGGTYVQPDSNLPGAETLCRQFDRGLSYFQSRFGKWPTIGWQADSFGHTPGWPNILRSFGMDGFAFTRPQRKQFPLDSPVFWWETDYDDKLLCYRQHFMWYCSERANLREKLDFTLAGAVTQPFTNVGLLMGLGNHGGGPSRRHLADVAQWAEEHPQVEVRYSTLHGIFAAIREEMAQGKSSAVPSVKGDLGFCLRGCYSSVAKFKNVYRHAEAALPAAEATQAVILSGLGAGAGKSAPVPLDQAWDAILFNSFHDILPGSSIERAFDDQLAWVGVAAHQAKLARFSAMNRLASVVDTSVPAPSKPDKATDVSLLVWNPLPRPVTRWFEIEASMDYRPLWGHGSEPGSVPLVLYGPDGTTPRHQEIATEHTSMRDVAWRRRLAVYDSLPAYGWKVYRFGYRDKTEPPTWKAGGCTASSGTAAPFVASPDWRVEVSPQGQLRVSHKGANLFDGSGALQVRLVNDVWGSWGGMNEEPASFCLEETRETWSVTRSHVLESGPERAVLWTRWQGKNSWLELTFHVATDMPFVRVKGRLLMNDRSARVKLVLPSHGRFEMEVPASRVVRDGIPGHVPCGRWVSRGGVGFVSDVLSDVDATDDELRVTLSRASRYADDVATSPDQTPWLAAVDCGEIKFECLLTTDGADLPAMAQELLNAPDVLLVPAHTGTLPRSGSFGSIAPASVQVLSARPQDGGTIKLRLQNTGAAREVTWRQGDKSVSLGELKKGEIKSFTVHAE
jgi:alpha-mannosidase